ncbi:MAG TPA: nicotinamide-nucleotide amidohydrolase family protein [Steroidobacteraceae bacterium]|nr:nicotinamide-nucleotide amidohydrolase family protein [Steroidobacteraceae bacterium]
MAHDSTLRRLAERTGRALLRAHQRVATAESCTGGWVAKALTDVAGSSQWFSCGYVTYSNEAKWRELAVPRATLHRHGAVSEATVRAMARGALRRTQVGIAVAVSGIAGPDGGTSAKPVGTVWFCIAWRRGRKLNQLTHRQRFRGDRESVRRKSVAHALGLIYAAAVVASHAE